MQTKRLLIVEDDYDVAEMLLMYFTSHQYEVMHADTGAAGIELARRRFPNLILLDVMLPHMNGYEVCLHLRQTSLTRHIPVIFLTQRDARADIVEGLQLGADDYIAKPFDVDELRLRVRRSIERATSESLHEPRTGLPAGPMVEEEIERVAGEPVHRLHFAIDNFKVFNDKYGFMASDQVMAFASRSIREGVLAHGTDDDFIGVMGDEFVVLTHVEDADPMANMIINQFGQGVRAFYTYTDVEQGGILIDQGTEYETLVPLMSLAPLSSATSA
jgi:DNA-binding response OmpR family regulator